MLITTREFLAEVDRFLLETGMSSNTLGRICVNNSKFIPRLREGVRRGTGDIKIGKVHQVLEFMEAERTRRRRAAE